MESWTRGLSSQRPGGGSYATFFGLQKRCGVAFDMSLTVKANLEVQFTAIQRTKARITVLTPVFYSAARTMKILTPRQSEHSEKIEHLAIYGQPRKQSY